MAGRLFNKGESALMNFCVLWKLGLVFTKHCLCFFLCFVWLENVYLLLVVVVLVMLF